MSQQEQERIETLSVANTRLASELAKTQASNAAMAKDRARLCEQVVDAQHEADDLRLRSIHKAISDSKAPPGMEAQELRDQIDELHRKLGESEARCEELTDNCAAATRLVADLRAELGGACVARALDSQEAHT